MDPADKQGSLSGQGALLGQHKQLLMGLMDNRSSVAQVVSDLEQKVLRLPGSVLPNPASAIWAGAAPLLRAQAVPWCPKHVSWPYHLQQPLPNYEKE